MLSKWSQTINNYKTCVHKLCACELSAHSAALSTMCLLAHWANKCMEARAHTHGDEEQWWHVNRWWSCRIMFFSSSSSSSSSLASMHIASLTLNTNHHTQQRQTFLLFFFYYHFNLLLYFLFDLLALCVRYFCSVSPTLHRIAITKFYLFLLYRTFVLRKISNLFCNQFCWMFEIFFSVFVFVFRER